MFVKIQGYKGDDVITAETMMFCMFVKIQGYKGYVMGDEFLPSFVCLSKYKGMERK